MSGDTRYDLQDRLIDFAVLVNQICESLPSTRMGKHVAGQLVRCGTAPAPLHAEAQGAESRRDFVHKLRLCVKELRETMSWLKYVHRLEIGENKAVDKGLSDCDRLIRILVASIKTAVRNDRKRS